MNDAQNAEMGIRIFIYDQNTILLYLIITYNHTDHTITLLCSYDEWLELGSPTGDHWRGPSSWTPQKRMSHPPPGPYHWARSASAGSAKPDKGRGLKSVCSGNFTHVTHIVKLYMYIKYYCLRTLHIWNIANKTSFISCTLFHIFGSVANWPGLFWRRGEGARKVCQNPDICSFRVNTSCFV